MIVGGDDHHWLWQGRRAEQLPDVHRFLVRVQAACLHQNVRGWNSAQHQFVAHATDTVMLRVLVGRQRHNESCAGQTRSDIAPRNTCASKSSRSGRRRRPGQSRTAVFPGVRCRARASSSSMNAACRCRRESTARRTAARPIEGAAAGNHHIWPERAAHRVGILHHNPVRLNVARTSYRPRRKLRTPPRTPPHPARG